LYDYAAPKSYGVSSSTQILLVFENESSFFEEEVITLKIKDIITESETYVFDFEKELFINPPELRIK
jgi:hypothetical protein